MATTLAPPRRNDLATLSRPENPELVRPNGVVFIDLGVPIRRGLELVQEVSETCPGATIIARVRLPSGAAVRFRVEIHEGKLRLSPEDETIITT